MYVHIIFAPRKLCMGEIVANILMRREKKLKATKIGKASTESTLTSTSAFDVRLYTRSDLGLLFSINQSTKQPIYLSIYLWAIGALLCSARECEDDSRSGIRLQYTQGTMR